jgi:hypothetical protein
VEEYYVEVKNGMLLKRFMSWEKQIQTKESLTAILMIKKNEMKTAVRVIKPQEPSHMPRG